METPDGLRYSSEHEWVRVEGDLAVVGITDFAQDSLGDIVWVQLPEVGSSVEAGAAITEIESTKSVSDVYAPVSGVVEAVNTGLEQEPERINSDPYGEGWIFRVRITDPSEIDRLLDAGAYRALVEGS
jgi:glycine cleavage system H protein